MSPYGAKLTGDKFNTISAFLEYHLLIFHMLIQYPLQNVNVFLSLLCNSTDAITFLKNGCLKANI